ncbi:ATP synthase regulation protein NCA2-domain-containing protein [Scheffersomyces xylosifermentans]|uniref:ATP synthase regulation protein NCA2-domain-containing protein n=1 Tax=Scheffersomyces xylosifermentans TaxID=1304137 RepID=UPI00315D67B0
MDLLSPGILSSKSRSSKILIDINSNNRISLRIKKRLKETNKLTTEFLTNELNAFSQQLNQKRLEEKTTTLSLQDSFQSLYYLLNLENFKFNKVSSIKLSQLKSIYSKIKDLECSDKIDTSEVGSINSTTNELINYYYTYLIALNLSNSLIYKTLVLKNQSVYWEELYNSRFSKLVYFVQISPIKLYEFGLTIYDHLTERLKSEYNDQFYRSSEHYTCIFFQSVNKTIQSAFVTNNPTISLVNISATTTYKWYRSIILFVWKTPFNLVNQEISRKLDRINNEISLNTSKIDALLATNLNDKASTLSSLESILSIKSPVDNENERVFNLVDSVQELDSQYNPNNDAPSLLTRYWLPLLLLIAYGPSESRNIYNNRAEIIQWIKHNLIDTTVGFFKNWLAKPINDMLNILRNDENISITSKESLQSDLDSLERMVLQFLDDERISGVDKAQVHESIQNGDLTLLMSKYENEIRSPMKSLVTGSLVRNILIQIQKTKVDGGMAINGIDKLLKSQQLVFGIVAVSPSLFIVYELWSWLTSSRPIIVNGKQVNIVCLKSLNNIENLLVLLNNEKRAGNSADSNYEGQLLIEIINLIVSANLIIPKMLKKDWIRDLNELNNSDFDIETKLDLVRKIWNMYGPYFR